MRFSEATIRANVDALVAWLWASEAEAHELGQHRIIEAVARRLRQRLDAGDLWGGSRAELVENVMADAPARALALKLLGAALLLGDVHLDVLDADSVPQLWNG